MRIPLPSANIPPAHGSADVFNIADAQSYRVDVYHYQQRIGRLYLRLSHITDSQDIFFLQLSNVAYIEAPSSWQGAVFDTATQADYATFIAERNIPINSLRADAMRLYVLDVETSVRIVASTAQVLDELPTHI